MKFYKPCKILENQLGYDLFVMLFLHASQQYLVGFGKVAQVMIATCFQQLAMHRSAHSLS